MIGVCGFDDACVVMFVIVCDVRMGVDVDCVCDVVVQYSCMCNVVVLRCTYVCHGVWCMMC